ncbi:MAG: hypothetical protein ACRD97_10460 [Nitrososphaeraceae archaeon]|jgi:hypothetical protein
MSNNIEVQRVKRRAKGILIPVSEYDSPPTAFEHEKYRYVAGAKGHYLRLTEKTSLILN